INLLCGRALLGAWANRLQQVDKAVVDQAAREVFGPASTAPPHGTPNGRAYLLASLAVALSAAVALVLLQTRSPASGPTASASAPLGVAAVAPRPAASLPQSPASAASALPALESIDALLPQLASDPTAAWHTLAQVWKLAQTPSDPCHSALAPDLQCYRANDLTLPQLRQLGRPGILRLQSGTEAPVFAVLVGIGEDSALLQVGSALHQVRLRALATLWHGEFATFWRAPPGYAPNLREGASGPVIDLLARQLAAADGSTPPAAAQGNSFDAALKERVRAFQRTQGLKPDGQPGPWTFMQIERATQTQEARLQTLAP
ncbi:MAG: peptidoglycan-binding protein, partial [Rhodoferax sp.]